MINIDVSRQKYKKIGSAWIEGSDGRGVRSTRDIVTAMMKQMEELGIKTTEWGHPEELMWACR